jgi:hypothetical protein
MVTQQHWQVSRTGLLRILSSAIGLSLTGSKSSKGHGLEVGIPFQKAHNASPRFLSGVGSPSGTKVI